MEIHNSPKNRLDCLFCFSWILCWKVRDIHWRSIVLVHICTQCSSFKWKRTTHFVQWSSPYSTKAYWMPLVHIWNGNVIGKEVILSNSSICNFQCFYHIRYDEIHRVVAFLGTFETRIIFKGGKKKSKRKRINMDVANTSNWTCMAVILSTLHSDFIRSPEPYWL